MSVLRFLSGFTMQDMSGQMGSWPIRYVCDTEAERPASGLAVGSQAYCKDTQKIYQATSPTQWVEVGGSGGAASWGGITGTLSSQSDLQGVLDAKAAAAHNHAGVYAPAAHNHDGSYAPISHGHDASAISSGTVATARLGSGAADSTKFLRGDQTWSAPGADPWTYQRLANDFSTSSATAVDVTGLGFIPAANQRYEFEAVLMLRTATATVNPRAGLAWATGLSDGVASLFEAQSATASLQAHGNIAASILVAVGGVPNTTQSWPCTARGMAVAGASPAGNIRIQLASETAGTNVTAKAGSFLKYRTIP